MAGEYQIVMEGLWWYVPGANVMRDGTWQSELVDLKHPDSGEKIDGGRVLCGTTRWIAKVNAANGEVLQ